ncbi:MAG: hypothetical protein ABSG30_02615 [Steroidobacteraceae bacterium]
MRRRFFSHFVVLAAVLGTHLPPPSVLWGAVGGDIRMDLFDHLSGQGTRYFVDQFPGALAGRITAAANAAWLIESSLTWNTIPPGVAVIASILVLGTIMAFDGGGRACARSSGCANSTLLS